MPTFGMLSVGLRKPPGKERKRLFCQSSLLLVWAITPSMMHVHRPLDGAPMQLLKRLSSECNIWLGGSFLAESGGQVYNTFVLALPDGRTFTHDKDFPTADVEQWLYAPGNDVGFLRLLRNPTRTEVIPSREDNNSAGVFEVGNIRVGNAMFWELVRKQTDAY